MREKKREGKLLPVYEHRVRAMLGALPETEEKVMSYSHDGKDVKEGMADALKALIESMPSAFKNYSKEGDPEPEAGEQLSDAGAELDRRVTLYREKNPGKSYKDMAKAVLAQDPQLAARYNEMEKN